MPEPFLNQIRCIGLMLGFGGAGGGAEAKWTSVFLRETKQHKAN